MDCRIIHLEETDSTNRWLKTHRLSLGKGENVVVWTDYQTDGRGCGSNTWESERGKNLLFSLLLHPRNIKASNQFEIKINEAAICSTVTNSYP